MRDQATILQQLDAVGRIMASELVIAAVAPQEGTHVRIVAGPLHGVEGPVEDPRSPCGVVVAIDMIQQGVLIHLPPESIEVVV